MNDTATDMAFVALDPQRIVEMKVGVGPGNTPYILPVRQGLVINDELALKLLCSNGARIVRRPGRVLEVFNFQGPVFLNNDAPVLTKWEQSLPDDRRLVAVCFRGGGSCALIENADGSLHALHCIGLSVQLRERSIHIRGPFPSPGADGHA